MAGAIWAADTIIGIGMVLSSLDSLPLCLTDDVLDAPRIFLTRVPKRLIEIQASSHPYETGDSLSLAVIQVLPVLQLVYVAHFCICL